MVPIRVNSIECSKNIIWGGHGFSSREIWFSLALLAWIFLSIQYFLNFSKFLRQPKDLFLTVALQMSVGFTSWSYRWGEMHGVPSYWGAESINVPLSVLLSNIVHSEFCRLALGGYATTFCAELNCMILLRSQQCAEYERCTPRIVRLIVFNSGWLASDWSECVPICGGGRRTRSVYCVHHAVNQTLNVPEKYCENQTKPVGRFWDGLY